MKENRNSMSLYNDQKYVNLISCSLVGFNKKKDYLYNFRCPYCGDSAQKQQKKRGYIFRKTNGLYFMCHNCGTSTTMGNLIKFVAPVVFKEYLMDEYKDSQNGRQKSSKGNLEKIRDVKSAKPDFGARKKEERKLNKFEHNTIYNLPDDDPAKEYIVNRKIPVDRQKELFVVEDFKEYVDTVFPANEYNLVKNDRRIIIPMKTKGGILVGFQGRAIGKSNLRYITIKIREDLPKIYGLDRADLTKKLYVVEGPIDSMFLPNAIAMAGSDMSFDVDKDKTVIMLDNEKRNKEITKRMEKIIADGYKIVIWPDDLKEKDINDMILADMTLSDILNIIDSHTFSGLKAKMAFKSWVR